MRVLVVGATGGSGRAAVETLLSAGHDVTAFSRHITEPRIHPPNLSVIRGDAMNPDDVDRAVAGHDAVVVTLGRGSGKAKSAVNVCSEGTRNVIAAMQRHGVRTLVVESALGVGQTRNRLPWLRRLMADLFQRAELSDKLVQERLVRSSDLDWLIIQPVALTNRPPRLDIYLSTAGDARRSTIARKDVADFIARALGTGEFVHQSVALSG